MSNQTQNVADQADVLAQLEGLTADLATAQTTITTLQGQGTVLTGERDSTRSDLATATQERDEARTSLGAVTRERDSLKSENATLKEQMADFNKRLAAELSRHGIRNSEASAKPAPQENRKLTATEEVLARKGVKSLEELSANRRAEARPANQNQ
jgi:uncharacterized protein (DUF3084 family)